MRRSATLCRWNFNPRSPCGERLPAHAPKPWNDNFNPRSPCGERPGALHCVHLRIGHFNPRSPCGERRVVLDWVAEVQQFQPTLPMRGATQSARESVAEILISTHAPHAGSDQTRRRGRRRAEISTHAPHAGSDRACAVMAIANANFNPRSPCGERRRFHPLHRQVEPISTHAPHAGSDAGWRCRAGIPWTISTHAPHAGSDVADSGHVRAADSISTHAPHAGSDGTCSKHASRTGNFNPRSPCGERLQHIVLLTISLPDIVKSHSRKQKRAS